MVIFHGDDVNVCQAGYIQIWFVKPGHSSNTSMAVSGVFHMNRGRDYIIWSSCHVVLVWVSNVPWSLSLTVTYIRLYQYHSISYMHILIIRKWCGAKNNWWLVIALTDPPPASEGSSTWSTCFNYRWQMTGCKFKGKQMKSSINMSTQLFESPVFIGKIMKSSMKWVVFKGQIRYVAG